MNRYLGVPILLSSLPGSFGVDRFHRGQIGLGVRKLWTFGGCGGGSQAKGETHRR